MRRAGLTIDVYSDAIFTLRESDTLGIQTNLDSFPLHNVEDRRGCVLILAQHQARTHLDDGHLAPEAAKHLSELEADVAASDDDQMRRQGIELQYRGICKIADLIEAWHRRNYGSRAHVNENLVSRQYFVAKLTSCADTKRPWPV